MVNPARSNSSRTSRMRPRGIVERIVRACLERITDERDYARRFDAMPESVPEGPRLALDADIANEHDYEEGRA